MFGGFFNRWRRDKSGATAVEFGLIAMPFFILIFSILELGLMFTASSILEGAAHGAARVLRTGQAQQSGDALTFFRAKLCEQTVGLIDCSRIVDEVILSPDGTFTSLNVEPQYDADGNLISRGFDPGEENSVIVVRVAYRYSFITPFVGTALSGRADNSVPLVSTVALRNEPYDF